MATCPSCGEQITFKSFAWSVLPVWITCPSCKTRVVGNRLVQVLAIAQSALATLIALAAAVWVPFLLFASGREVSDAIEITLLFGTFATIFLIWLAGAFLARRFGRYAAGGEDRARPVILRNYFLATAVASIVVVSWWTIYAGINPAAPQLLVAWAFVPLLALYPLFSFRKVVRLRQTITVVLLLWAGVFNLSATVVAVYVATNYPKEQPFEERLVFSFGTVRQEDAWYQLRGMLAPSNHAEPDRNDTLEFLAQTVASLPEEAANIFSIDVRWYNISGFADEEIAEIEELLGQGNGAAAGEKYLQLWRVAENLASGNGDFLKTLVTLGIVSDLVDLHLDDGNIGLLPGQGELLAMLDAMPNKLDGSVASAISLEYLTFKKLLPVLRQDDCGTDSLCVVIDLLFSWPFFDQHKTLRAQHDRWSALVALSTQPFSRNQRAQEAYRNKEADLLRFARLNNPVGSAFNAALSTTRWDQFIEFPQLAKARLSVLRYFLEAAESGDYGNIPIEPMTGEPFIVTDKGDTVEITSAYLKDEKPAIRYAAAKAPR